MTQPSFVPIGEADQVRQALRLEVPRRWSQDRPADRRSPHRLIHKGTGAPGPDQGYALRLARHLADQLRLGPDEHLEDVVVGCALLASRRSALFGRAPTIFDVRHAATLFGYLVASPTTSVPLDLVETWTWAFQSVSHDYVAQRALVDRVPDQTLKLTTEQVAEELGGWRDLFAA